MSAVAAPKTWKAPKRPYPDAAWQALFHAAIAELIVDLDFQMARNQSFLTNDKFRRVRGNLFAAMREMQGL